MSRLVQTNQSHCRKLSDKKKLFGKLCNLCLANLVVLVSFGYYTVWFQDGNGNWTEYSAIWSGVLSKPNNRARRVWFQTKIYHFITSVLKAQNLIVYIQELLAQFAKQWLFCFSFSYNVIGFHSHRPGKRCNLEQKTMWIKHLAES